MKRLRSKRTAPRMPLMTKLNLLFGTIIVLACGALSIFSYQANLQVHLSDDAAGNAVLLRTMAQSIDNRLSQVEVITQETAHDAELIRLLQDGSVTRQILSIAFSVGERMGRAEAYLTDLSADMVALSCSPDMVESYATVVYEGRLQGDAFYREFRAGNDTCGWGSPGATVTTSTTKRSEIPYYHKIIVGVDTCIGVVRCAVRTDTLFAQLANYGGEGTLMVLRDGEKLFGGGAAPASVPSERWQEGGNVYYSTPLDRLGASLVMGVQFDRIRERAMKDTALSTLAIFVVGVALLVAARWIVRTMLSRLHGLTRAVSAIPQGIYAVTLPEDGPDEVGQLARAFSSLLERVGTYYDELLRQEKDKRHAQTMALQYQINPHFLFNSLYWLQLQMEEQGVDPGLTASIEQLGKVLRYNLLGSREALLSEEEEQILAYVDFVSAMKDRRLRLTIDMPEALRGAKILRFTLQPLLENAIQHGYVPGQDLRLSIAFSADRARDRFEIAVHNDGRSIEPDQLAELQERLDSAAAEGLPLADQETGHGTAMRNLARRLALTYGDAAVLSVASQEGDTCVRIELPLSQCLRGGEGA